MDFLYGMDIFFKMIILLFYLIVIKDCLRYVCKIENFVKI